MKKVKKLSKINHAKSADSNQDALLKWGSKLILSCMLVIGFTKCYAQNPTYPIPPALEWQKSYWPATRPVMGSTTFVNQTRAESGEDWFYSVAKSKENGVQNGYIGSGYITYPNYKITETQGGCMTYNFNNECDEFETTTHNKGMSFGQISFVDLDGNKLWEKTFLQGELTNIIQTSDGNYLAVGTTYTTEGVFYNPNSTSKEDKFLSSGSCVSGNHKQKACLIKIDKNGEVIWKYIYGMQPYNINTTTASEQTPCRNDGL